MKKVILLVLSLVLLLNLSPAVAAEETGKQPETASVTVTADSVNTLPGREITIPVRMEGNPGFTNLAIALKYDQTKLELKSINPSDTNTTYLCGKVFHSTNNQWKNADNSTTGFLVAASPVPVMENGILFTATFLVKSDFADTTDVIPDVLYLRSNVDDYPVFRTITPNVTAGTIRAILPGDINGDGVVEYDDVMAAYQVSQSENKTFSKTEQMLVADMNSNGVIDDYDVSAIYNIYTGGK